jgi:WD40 repeat protein
MEPAYESIEAVDIAPDGRLIVGGGSDHIRTWDTGSGKENRVWNHNEVLTRQALAFSPNGKIIAAGLSDGTSGFVRMWNAATGKVLRSLPVEKVSIDVTGVAFSPDGKTLACSYGLSGSGQDAWIGMVKIWRTSDHKVLGTLKGHKQSVWQIAFAPDSRTLATASDDKTVRIWNVAQAKTLQILRHQDIVQAVAFAPDGKTLASGDNKVVRLWDVKAGQRLRAFAGHIAFVNSVAFSPDGKTLVSSSDDGSIRLWNVRTGQLRLTLRLLPSPESTSAQNWIAYTPEGYYDASTGADAFIRWRMEDKLYPAATNATEFQQPQQLQRALQAAP